jgi:ElaA protein
MQHFIFKYFDELTATELYDLLQLREEVFQLEQTCIYKDIDDKDRKCWHLLLYNNDELVAYARLLPEGLSYKGYSSIGRVVSKSVYRRAGYGRLVMKEALHNISQLFPEIPVKISAQAYLQHFYESFGFVRTGAPYLEDDIPHIAMIKSVLESE